MARRLFIVEDTFFITGHGLVPVPGIVPIDGERFRVGDPLLLKRPDGSELRTTIGGLEILSPNPTNQVVVVLKGLTKEDVPVGTEFWSVDTNSAS
jgi:hypothetical protein